MLLLQYSKRSSESLNVQDLNGNMSINEEMW